MPSTAVTDTFNEEAIREALQRLAVKQQSRQYAAVNSFSTLQQEGDDQAPNRQFNRRGSLSLHDDQSEISLTHPGALQRPESSRSASRVATVGRPPFVNDRYDPSCTAMGQQAPDLSVNGHQVRPPSPTPPPSSLGISRQSSASAASESSQSSLHRHSQLMNQHGLNMMQNSTVSMLQSILISRK